MNKKTLIKISLLLMMTSANAGLVSDNFSILHLHQNMEINDSLSLAIDENDYNAILTLAEEGNVNAQLFLASKHIESAINPTLHIVEAFKLIKSASNKGDIAANEILSSMYRNGHGTDKDYNQALSITMNLNRDTDDLDTIIDYSLINLYGNKQITPNINEAIFWLDKASKQGHLDSIILLSEVFENETFTRYNLDSANKYRLLAINQNHQPSVWMIANNFLNLNDLDNAFYWFKKADSLGFIDAKLYLGIFYSTGMGVDIDNVEAYVQLSIASSSGISGAKEIRNSVSRNLNNTDLIKAREKIRVYLNKEATQ